ncbi:CB1 cannabinoid receptor-interacting protein 1a isoform X2 [Oryzias melastigma]|uniref:CB1 cannabinoid receptor-interacting protein 1a isoform X2 n=1 Tax=Oryzias melastigma TaxID=30732 RepID=UPI000CF82063|nr:CB1 cannabinoid receptor-interacting protein 1a isoform X2 [Oryzias melastigma]
MFLEKTPQEDPLPPGGPPPRRSSAPPLLRSWFQDFPPSVVGFGSRNMNIGGVVFPLVQQSRDEDSVVYHGQYDTEGVPHTKSGDRQPVQVSIEFNKAGTFETVWQAKYYNYYKREHCQFGNKFSNIEYECKPNETRTLMWINKEVFN